MRKFFSIVAAVLDYVTTLALWLACAGVAALVIVYLYEVGARYFFNAPTSWAADAVSYVLAASVFLAMPKVTAEGGHVAVSFLVETISQRKARILTTVLYAVAALICVLIAWVCATENVRQFQMGTMTMAVHPIPKWWISALITFGFAGSAWHFLRAMAVLPRPGTESPVRPD